MGKVEEDPDYVKLLGADKYLPWHGHVTCLTVAPQYRKMGLAKTLTAHLDRACEQENAWFMDLFVRVSNKTAINMYKGMGYVLEPLRTLSAPLQTLTAIFVVVATAFTAASSTTTAMIRQGTGLRKTLSTCGNL